MPAVNPRTLVKRWFAGTVPAGWEEAQRYFKSVMARLEATLRVIHSAVEHPAPTAIARAACSGDTAINTTTDTAIPGASITFTPDVDMIALVIGNFDVNCSLWGAETHLFIGSLYVNGVAQSGLARATTTSTNSTRALSQTWTVSLSSGTSYVFDLYGRTSNVATNFTARVNHTTLTVIKFPNLFRVV